MTKPEHIALEPCPFCGGEAKIEQFGDMRQSMIYACADCGVRLETGEVGNGKRLWNCRSPGWRLADPLPKEIPPRLGDWRDTKAALEALIPGYMQLPEGLRKALWDFSEALPKVHPEMSFKCCECEQLFSRVHQYRCADCHAACCPDCIRPHFGPNHKPHEVA